MIIKLGNWFFRYRNIFFIVLYGALFIPAPEIFPEKWMAVLAGSMFILPGLLIRSITIGWVYIIRGGANHQIHAEKLVTGGVYQICRNPMYLGNILLLFGFGLFANSLLYAVLLFPLFLLIYFCIIRAEEAFLQHKFGAEFEEYRSHTKALIPDFSQIRNAFQGYVFNIKRVISKEHNSWYLYLMGMLALIAWHGMINWKALLAVAFLITLIYGIIKGLKRKKKFNS